MMSTEHSLDQWGKVFFLAGGKTDQVMIFRKGDA
jgi:hypothetical protein